MTGPSAAGGGDDDRPLVAGSLRGYRTWHVLGRRTPVPAGTLPLTSLTRRRVVWSRTLEASCTPPDVDVPGVARAADAHPSPSRRCTCGIYAWYRPQEATVFVPLVFGAIEASGLVLMGERGFRAERARITAVATRRRRVAAACEAAGIAVYRRRRDLLRDHPPEDVSGLLEGPPSASPTPRPPVLGALDAVIVLAVWGRAVLIALAATLLPFPAMVAGIIAAEVTFLAVLLRHARGAPGPGRRGSMPEVGT